MQSTRDTIDSPLAIDGGTAAKSTPYGSMQRFDERELAYLREALAQNTLFYGHGRMVHRACEQMATYTGRSHAVACSSGTAAVHLGLVAAGVGPGDEVVCTPHTDSGSVVGAMLEGAVPVFADQNPSTLQPTVESIEAALTARTRAVVVVHLAGLPAPVDAIADLCQRKGLPMVEDCAQAWGARLHGRLVGTWGMAGCFSTNDYKHISTGDGGFVVLDDPELYRRVSNYADKYYDRLFGRERYQHYLGVNYRMTELQGAVALAQLEKLEGIVSRYHHVGERLRQALSGIDAVEMIGAIPGGYATYWWVGCLLELEKLKVSSEQVIAALVAEGVGAGRIAYNLMSSTLLRQGIVRPWLKAPHDAYPLLQPDGRHYTYDAASLPGAARIESHGLRLTIGPGYSDQDVDEMATAIAKVMHAYCR